MSDLFRKSLNTIRGLFAQVEEKQAAPTTANTMLIDARGRHCPLNLIGKVDLARHELVNGHCDKAAALAAQIAAFKQEAFSNVDAFVEVSNNEHGAKIGGVGDSAKRKWKGNLQLINHNATRKINLKINDKIAFNENLNNAMEKINGLIKERSAGIDEILEVLVNDAFKVDQAGYIDVKKVLDLRRHKIKHPVWQSAMEDINDSIQVIGSKAYIQFWQRPTPEDEWQAIALDIARL